MKQSVKENLIVLLFVHSCLKMFGVQILIMQRKMTRNLFVSYKAFDRITFLPDKCLSRKKKKKLIHTAAK